MRKFILLVAVILLSNQSLFSQVPSYVPSNGLVGFWPFSGNANDSSVNGNVGTVNGATLTTDRNGVANSAYSFNGSSSYISVPNNATFNFQNKFTFSYWINPNSLSVNELSVILSKQVNYGPDQNGFNSSVEVGSYSNFRVQNGTSNPAFSLSTQNNSILINNWYHVVHVWTGTQGYIYINGRKSFFVYYKDYNLYYHTITQFRRGKLINLTYACENSRRDSYMPYIFRVVNSLK